MKNAILILARMFLGIEITSGAISSVVTHEYTTDWLAREGAKWPLGRVGLRKSHCVRPVRLGKMGKLGKVFAHRRLGPPDATDGASGKSKPQRHGSERRG